MGRRETRENAMKILYQVNIQRDDVEEQIQRFLQENPLSDAAELQYFEKVVKGVMGLTPELDERIARHARGWSVERLPKVDLAILRVSVYELTHLKDIPPMVSINEAVELTKKYGTDQSRSYVNGVLGKIYEEVHGKVSAATGEAQGEDPAATGEAHVEDSAANGEVHAENPAATGERPE